MGTGSCPKHPCRTQAHSSPLAQDPTSPPHLPMQDIAHSIMSALLMMLPICTPSPVGLHLTSSTVQRWLPLLRGSHQEEAPSSTQDTASPTCSLLRMPPPTPMCSRSNRPPHQRDSLGRIVNLLLHLFPKVLPPPPGSLKCT
jgi:hypothetical protein